MKWIFIVSILFFCSCTTSHPTFTPKMPSICKTFLHYKPLNLTCYTVICVDKNDRVQILDVDKTTGKYGAKCLELLEEEEVIDDSETCWWNFYDEYQCIA